MNNVSRIIAVAGATVLAGGVLISANLAHADSGVHKVYVCKYVGKPGVDERLKAGRNPILVAYQSTDAAAPVVGAWFNDAQGRSQVVGLEGDPEPDVSACQGQETN